MSHKCANIKSVNTNADVAELADALVLGTSVNDVGVQVPSSAPKADLLELVKSTAISEFKVILKKEYHIILKSQFTLAYFFNLFRKIP